MGVVEVTEEVRGLILAPNGDSAADLARPLAGAPLLVRQLEWLHANGIRRVLVNRVPSEPLPPSLSSAILESTGVKVTWIPSVEPLSARELAQRSAPLVALGCVVPHGHVGDLDLLPAIQLARASSSTVRVEARGRAIEIVHFGSVHESAVPIAAHGWLAEITEEGIAHGIVEAVLAGQRRGIEVRGTAQSPGIYRAHGSFVSPSALVTAPCYFGVDSYVASGARVGPGAVIGEGAVIERGAKVIHARVAANVVVGQGVRVERACADAGRIERHGGGRVVSLEDELLLGRRGLRARPARIAASVAARLMYAATTVVGREQAEVVARRLSRVADARGTWLGVRDANDPDAVVINVAALLVPDDASEEEHTAARALYARKKSWRLDLSHLARMMRQRRLG